MQIKNISPNRPKDLVLDLPEDDAEELLKTGEFEKLIKEKLVVKKASFKKDDEDEDEE